MKIKTIGNNNIKFFDKYSFGTKLYHLTELDDFSLLDHLNLIPQTKIFEPRIPTPNRRMGLENKTIKRICTSTSIMGAIHGGGFNENSLCAIYSPDKMKNVYILNEDTKKYVPDADLTNEVWIRNKSIIFNLIGHVIITNKIFDGYMYLSYQNNLFKLHDFPCDFKETDKAIKTVTRFKYSYNLTIY